MESSAENFSGIPQYVLSRLNLTVEKSYCNGNATESCQSSQFGTTLEHSTASHGAGSLTLCAAAFPVRESVLQAQARGLPINAAGCGGNKSGLLAKYDPIMSLWKTPQCFCQEESEQSSVIFPNWGMMQNGELYLLKTPVLFKREKGFGFVPTPEASIADQGCCIRSAIRKANGEKRPSGASIGSSLRTWENLIPWLIGGGREYPSPLLLENLMAFPSCWTGLEPLEMHKFQEWLDSHGLFSLPKQKKWRDRIKCTTI